MPAEIIPFPKKTPHNLKVSKSVDLFYCWDQRLNNPLLNSLFKPEVTYVERWYLQSTHLLNLESFDHPIIKTLLSKDDNTLNILKDATERDLIIQHYFVEKSTIYSDYHVARLNRWLVKWQGLLLHRQRL
jgi:hypothetical protein